MVSERTWADASRGLVFLLMSGVVTGALGAFTPQPHPYLQVVAGLGLTLGIVGAVDVLPQLIRGDRPALDTNSYLYSLRGLVWLLLIILLTALIADLLRATTTLSETAIITTGFAVGVVLVLGPVVGYYWRRSAAQTR
ncbi:hypothetical protein [Haloglomus halophilum]|uniref:hypothetical protein n=1 Tax=Haloglomus halophilum TaxID=2962672 RepID=UPI0020C972B4|nr:hypothetical protein [Haloglomus halophilum]